jgi:lipopolysaccharide/colanic/teichoic acid biosynthesis glycosyltransferase
MLVVAGLVKVISPGGPAFFSQPREGRDGKPIRIWKIRSMVPDATAKLEAYLASDAAARAEFARTLKLRRDPRVLPYIGGFIRRASIDELPQLWSVIVGDLSLVGPRVMMLADVGQMAPEARETRREVPPGLTGLWQVNFRNNSDLHVRGVADAYYVHNWSVWLDLWILLRTVRVVFFGSGAY